MSKNRVKKRFTSDVNVIDFQTYAPHKKHRVTLLPRSKHQEIYLQMLQNERKNIVFAIGPAGTGKTLLAVQNGIKLLQEGVVDKIIVTRPAVSVDEDLGFLPGTLNEKMAPWTRPIFDVLGEYYDQKTIENFLFEGVIEISPLAYMRGRTFKNAYVVADEMQNATQNQMKMLLTRLGENSKMVVTGDLAQADRLQDNGLIDFINKITNKKMEHIDVVQFDHKDIERHKAVAEVLKIYGDE
jgi:phosphate starvation-inducible protein PhoH and related proteins